MLETILPTTRVEPRDYQRRIINQADKQFNEVGVRSVLIESPTGSGKTCMALLIARMLQERHNIGIAWIAMRRNLLSQAQRENTKLEVGAEIETVSMFDKSPPTHDAQGRPIRAIIVDEAQHDAASSMATLHNFYKPDYVLGMTATPFRTDRMKLCFDKIIKDIGIHQLIQSDFLSKYHMYTIHEWVPETVAATYLRDKERWGKSVIFWHKQEDAAECVARLCAAGVKAELLLGSQGLAHREEVLEAFENGDVDVIANLFLLTEGFDSPSLKTVFVRDSQRGPTIQMSGRVFRKYPGIAYKNVVQSQNTRWPMVKTALPAEQFVWMAEDDEWRSYKLNKNIAKIAVRSALMSARREVEIPAIIKKNQKRRSERNWF